MGGFRPMGGMITSSWGDLHLRREDYGNALLSEWSRSSRGQTWSNAFAKISITRTNPTHRAKANQMVELDSPP
jgi:hypothetical protein